MHDLKSHYNKILLREYMKNQFVISFIFLFIGSQLLAGGNGGGGGVRPSNKLAQSNQNPNYFSSFAAGNQRGTIDSARTVLVETEVSQAIGGGGSGGGGVLDSLSSEAKQVFIFAGVGGGGGGVHPSNKLARSNHFIAGNQCGTIDSARTALVETEVSQGIGGGGGSTTGSKIAGGALGFNPLNKKMTGHEV